MRLVKIMAVISLLSGIVILFFLISLGRNDFKVITPPKPNDLPSYAMAPEFQLTGSDGQPFQSSQLEGNIWVVDFFFSSCGGPCPAMAGNMQKLQAQFGDRNDVKLVNISVDPATDTPETLKRYGERLKADPNFWYFLGGPAEQILKIAVEGFKVGDPDNVMNHSPKFILVDRQGLIRGYYTGTEAEETQALIRDLEKLL